MTETAGHFPLTHEQADAKLAEMTAAYRGPGEDPKSKLHAAYADDTKRQKLEAGDLATKREFDELIKAVTVPADPVEAALSGKLSNFPTSEELQLSRSASMLRGLGLSDDAVREAISDSTTSQEIHDAAKAWKAQHLSDQDWVKRWLNGDAEAIKEMTLCGILLTQPIKGKAA